MPIIPDADAPRRQVKPTPPPAPEGYEFVGYETETPALPSTVWRMQRPQQRTVAVYQPVAREVPTQLFGPKVSYLDPESMTFTEVLRTRQGEEIRVPVQFMGGAGEDPTTRMAFSGLGLSTVTAGGLINPVAGGISVLAVATVDPLKTQMTGQHLTVEEAIGVAGLAQIGTLAAQDIYYSGMVQRGITRISNRLSPERALAERVFGAEDAKLLKVTPEERMFHRVTAAKPDFTKPAAYSTPNRGEWSQSLLYQKPAIQHTAMSKTLAPLVTVPKEITITAATPILREVTKKPASKAKATQTMMKRQQTELIQQATQTQNPFLTYPGRSYYPQRQRIREGLVDVVLSYPASGLAHPQGITYRDITRVDQGLGLVQTPIQVPVQTPIQGLTEAQIETQIQEQVTRQDHALIEQAVGTQQQRQRPYGLELDLKGYSRLPKLYFGLYGRVKRRYPVKTVSQWLKELTR